MEKLIELDLSEMERRLLPTSLQTVFCKPVGDGRAAEKMKFALPKYGGQRVLNFGSRKPISKIRLE